MSWIKIFSFSVLLLLSLSLVTFAQTNTVKLPEAGRLGGRQVSAGNYTVEIDHSADKPYLRLIQNGKLIATDIAIVLPSKGSNQSKSSATLTKVGKKKYIRIQVQEQNQWYFVYLESKP